MIVGLGRTVVTVEVHYGAWGKISAWELLDVEPVGRRDMPRSERRPLVSTQQHHEAEV